MTGRSLPEWIGKTPSTPVPPRVKIRIWERDNGHCHITGRKIKAGEAWECDHVIALINGGENRETNLAPALKAPHRKKTAQDVKIKSKIARIQKRHLGIYKPSSLSNVRFKKRMNGDVVDRRTGEII